MTQFRDGDRIVVVNPTEVSIRHPYHAGDKGVVISARLNTLRVRFDRHSYIDSDDYVIVYVSEVRKIEQEPPATPKLQWTRLVGEQTRTYHFPGGHTFTINRVTHLAVRPTNHRLQTVDGKKFVIPGTFVAIEIDAAEWTA